MISLDHIAKLKTACGYIEPIIVNESKPINTADPYLSENDAKILGNKNHNDGFTINFKNNKSQTINIVSKNKPNKSPTNNNIININNILSKSNEQNNMQSENNISTPDVKEKSKSKSNKPVEVLIASNRQQKILVFLEKLKDPETCGSKLIEILDNKLHIDDYKNLQSLISQSININENLKTIYESIIQKFTMALVKLKTKGHTTYKDKDIATLVMNLTR
jgi:hypothetical protein